MIRRLFLWGSGFAVLAVAVLAFTGKKTFHVEIAIPAPPAAVWAVLTDARGYADWNPVFTHVAGAFRQGATVKTIVKEPGKPEVTIESEIVRLVPERELNQFGGMRGFITFDHRWLLQSVEGGTKVTQYEVDRGLWVWFWDSGWVEPAYRKASEALRDRVLERHRK
ncbi:MAG: SRPBCC family protein [Rhodospirillaceae bacterium]|nr:SRPBCC family protein [Rhodospirillaceae bacterium]MCY4065426.1 SRPBCC family protein [Rhodospirillaceae bacterium]